METTWSIREGVCWHDGAPFTTDDLLFTATMGRDREVAILNNPAWASVEEVTAPDDRTVTVRWREPYIDADQVFSQGTTLPPENNFQVGGPANWGRYMNAELDGLVAAYFRTIPLPERVSVLGRIIRHVAEQLPVMGLYYSGQPDAFANRLVNVSPRWSTGVGTNPAWNAHDWDIKS